MYTGLTGHSWLTMFNFVSPCQSTPLHYAAGKGDAVAAEVLMRKGADINMNDDYGVRE